MSTRNECRDKAGAPDVALHTPRLTLQPFLPADIDSLRELFAAPQVRRYLWDDQAPSREQVAALQAVSARTFREHGWGLWLLRRPGNEVLVGYCGLRPVVASGEVELGYALSPEHWGLGLATEAARAALGRAFARPSLAYVIALTDVPNEASQRVLLRLGFRLEGVLAREGPTLLRWNLQRGDWLAAQLTEA